MSVINSIGPVTISIRMPTRTARSTIVGPYTVVDYEDGESEYKLECSSFKIKEQRRRRGYGSEYSLEFEGSTSEVFEYDPERL